MHPCFHTYYIYYTFYTTFIVFLALLLIVQCHKTIIHNTMHAILKEKQNVDRVFIMVDEITMKNGWYSTVCDILHIISKIPNQMTTKQTASIQFPCQSCKK